MAGNDAVPISCVVIRSTDNAVLVGFECDGTERWVPRSVIEDDKDDIHTEVDELSIHRWWLEREGLA